MPEKLQKYMAKAEFADAVTEGKEYLADEPGAPDARQVRDLVRAAEYAVAKQQDTLGGYENFERHYPDSEFQKDLTERKSLVYYRTITVPAGTPAAHQEFRSLYPVSSLANDSIQQENQLAWNLAEKDNGVDAWKELQATYPSHPRLAEARRNEAEAAWKTASGEGTVEALETYAKAYPESPRSKEALDASCAKGWGDALNLNTVQGYRDFRGKFARCAAQSGSAMEKEQELAWKEALTNETAADFLKFSREYPNSPHARDALDKACVKAWNDAQQGDALENYRDFRTIYAGCSAQAPLAREKEFQRAWETAEKTDTWEAYRTLQDEYPDHPRRREAEQRERELWGFAGPVAPDEFTTSITSLDDRDPANIHLFVQVADKDGRVVGGLGKSNFTAFENGKRVELSGFKGMETERPVDIVFVFDTSGSMQEEIDGVKEAAIQFAENLRMRNRDARLALVTFSVEMRDVYDFTGDIRMFQRWVAGQRAHGGDNRPENPLDALRLGMSLHFRPHSQRVFVLITDEPANENNDVTSLTISAVGQMLKSGRISLFQIAPEIDQYRQLSAIVNGTRFDIANQAEFSRLIEDISTMAAKQYTLIYRGAKHPGGIERQARVRARQDYLCLPTTTVKTRDIAALAIDPREPEVSYLATRDSGLFRSLDGGETWSAMAEKLPEKSFEEIFPVSSEGKSLLTRSSSGNLYASADGGENWRPVEHGFGAFDTVSQHPGDPLVLYSTDGVTLFASKDGGATWNKVSQLFPTKTAASLSVDPATGVISLLGNGTDARTSSDGGASWKTGILSVPLAGTNLSDYRLRRNPNRAGVSYLFKPGGDLYRALDGGRTWDRITPASPGAKEVKVHDLSFDPTDRNWLLASTSQGPFASSDGGVSWFRATDDRDTADLRNAAVAVGSDGRIQLAGKGSGNIYTLAPVADREFISGNVYFASGSAEINRNLQGYLDGLAVHLSRNETLRVRVEGHTDDVGGDEMNLKLSLARANSVRTYLAAKGIRPGRVITVGSGKARPLAPNDSADNRAKNRRVELAVIGG
jgi:OOP family OmpA-OmpF porin